MSVAESYSRRVSRGARLLDSRHPGWWRWINVQRLDTSSVRDCVLGQLVRNGVIAPPFRITEFRDVYTLLGLGPLNNGVPFGFDALANRNYALNCLKLDGLWRREISQRATRTDRTGHARGA